MEDATMAGHRREAGVTNDLGIGEGTWMIRPGLSGVKDVHVDLLEMILSKKPITLEKWASVHRLGRTPAFLWKTSRRVGKSLKGRVSGEKSAYIEAAIEADAKELRLTARTDWD
jgi:hypothetical protein